MRCVLAVVVSVSFCLLVGCLSVAVYVRCVLCFFLCLFVSACLAVLCLYVVSVSFFLLSYLSMCNVFTTDWFVCCCLFGCSCPCIFVYLLVALFCSFVVLFVGNCFVVVVCVCYVFC